MKKSQLITQILVNINPSFDYPEATRLFVHEFVKHFSDKFFHEWDSEVAPHIARIFLETVDVARSVDVKYLINELDTLCKQMQ